MTPIQAAWLAGILEGEGHFGSQRRWGGTVEARITLEMTDADVVDRAARLMGCKATPKAPRRGAPAHHKPQFSARISGRRALDVMRSIIPHLGLRRSERVSQVIADYHESRMFVCQECGVEFYSRRRGGVRPVACSETCQPARNRRKTAEWKAAHKEAQP